MSVYTLEVKGEWFLTEIWNNNGNQNPDKTHSFEKKICEHEAG